MITLDEQIRSVTEHLRTTTPSDLTEDDVRQLVRSGLSLDAIVTAVTEFGLAGTKARVAAVQAQQLANALRRPAREAPVQYTNRAARRAAARRARRGKD